jgi:UPF0716 protein FxsA
LFKLLLLLFIVVPFVELWLLLVISDYTGWQFTLGLVIVTGLAGAHLARRQGWRTLQRIRDELGQGKLPTDSLLDGMMILVAGALLLTPGILTDAVGLTLLIPPCRRRYRAWLVRWFKSRFHVQATTSGFTDEFQSRSKVIDSYVVDRSDDEIK